MVFIKAGITTITLLLASAFDIDVLCKFWGDGGDYDNFEQEAVRGCSVSQNCSVRLMTMNWTSHNMINLKYQTLVE